MHPVVLVALSALTPFCCLGLLLFLGWLEDTLDADVKKAERRRMPQPIRAIPVPEPAAAPVRTATAKPVVEPAARPVVAASEEPARPAKATDPLATPATP